MDVDGCDRGGGEEKGKLDVKKRMADEWLEQLMARKLYGIFWQDGEIE